MDLILKYDPKADILAIKLKEKTLKNEKLARAVPKFLTSTNVQEKGFYSVMPLHNYIVISLTKYATISVPAEVKKVLEKVKGGDEWGEFLLKLYSEVKRLKSEKAFKQLTNILTDEDLKTLLESTKEFRERFALR
jgi:predicted CopG family antitoxin